MSYNLLGVGNNSKVKKGDGLEYQTAIMHLVPQDTKICPFQNVAKCKEGCLVSAGRGQMNVVQRGRQRKTDMYLNDYFVFRTLAFKIEGVCEVREISLNAEPHSTFNNNTLFHSADMKYTGTVDLVITVDSKDVLIRTYTANAQVNEKRVYIPASTFGTIPFFKNNSHLGRISEMQFNSIDMVQ